MAKLTLSVDDKVIRRAKGYAARRGTTVSGLVERYLDLLTGRGPGDGGSTSRTLARLREELRGVSLDEGAYHKYLERKYR